MYMCLLLVHRVKPRLVVSKVNPGDLPPPKKPADESTRMEDETFLMPTKSGDRIASTPGGTYVHMLILYTIWLEMLTVICRDFGGSAECP